MRLNSSIMKSFSEDPLSPSAVANSANGGGAIVTTRRNTDTDNLQGSSSSALVEGHSEVTTLKNCKCARAPAVSSTMLHCPLPNDYCCGGGDAPLECKLHRQNISTRNCEMRHSNSKDFHLNERREMEAKMIAVASSPMAAIHYEHLAHRATATTTTTTPLAHIRSALQISQQSSSAPSSTSSASSAHLQGSEKLMAKMYNETQRCVPLKKCLEEMRNDYNNEQFKCYPTQSKRFDVACTSLNQGKFFRRRVTRQASFLAAVSASHSHQEVRSVSTHDLQSDRNYRTEETVKWRGTGSTTRLTSDYTNATKLNESPVTGLQRFSAHAWKGGEIKNNSNLPRHSTYYIPPENIFRNGIRFHDSISDQELQVVQKFLNIPKISPSNTANMRGQHQCSNAANSTSKRPANTTSNSALRNVCRSSLKIIPIGGSDYGDDLEFAINNSSTKRFAHADRSLNYLHGSEKYGQLTLLTFNDDDDKSNLLVMIATAHDNDNKTSTSLLPEITVTANRDRNVVRKCLARATSAETFSKDDGKYELIKTVIVQVK
ncbi:unnamed protein product [Litomosoides sigmodontis]|uniref:Uncharacterized protein n=1 Tax=Litomosoides sigmodontis TaxID=42156 RepID=A0A3P6STL5_LITSI|nr:unnamed protein product [Litomosoides sigmodontis]